MLVLPIRSYRPSDLDQMYAICLATGDAGGDASELCAHHDLLGDVYVGPYVRHEPSLAFVTVDDIGVAGYVLGARDVAAFSTRLEQTWWPRLRSKYPLDAEYLPHDRRLVELIHRPQAPPSWSVDVPSELHVDLLPRCQGTGAGRRLIETFVEALMAAGSPGVHLGVDARNQHAAGFYRHLGFRQMPDDDPMWFTMTW